MSVGVALNWVSREQRKERRVYCLKKEEQGEQTARGAAVLLIIAVCWSLELRGRSEACKSSQGKRPTGRGP